MSAKNAKSASKHGGTELKTMLKTDLRRMLVSSRLWIFLLAALLMPVLILTMTTMADGMTTVNPQTGEETAITAFESAWQIIGSESGEGMGGMDLTSMCNINLVFFLSGVFVCLFVADDFTSGFAKNVFTVRSKKAPYVLSKTIAGFAAGAGMLVCFFIGAVIGGKAAGLPFTLGSAGAFGLAMSMLSKILLVGVFVSIAVAVSAFSRRRAWLSILSFLFAGMLLFMMIPMMTPLNAGFMNVILCLAGSLMFALGLGKVSEIMLNKLDLV